MSGKKNFKLNFAAVFLMLFAFSCEDGFIMSEKDSGYLYKIRRNANLMGTWESTSLTLWTWNVGEGTYSRYFWNAAPENKSYKFHSDGTYTYDDTEKGTYIFTNSSNSGINARERLKVLNEFKTAPTGGVVIEWNLVYLDGSYYILSKTGNLAYKFKSEI